jgi:SagB-type dehydrogenase family enzyme
MSDDSPPFRDANPVAWTFHRNTSRWAHNAATAQDAAFPSPAKEHLGAPYVALPQTSPPAASLWDTLDRRFSCRHFRRAPLPLESLALLLHAAYGMHGRTRFGPLEFLERPVPSGGGLYPLELYALVRDVAELAPGVYHYVPLTHGLEQLRAVLVPRALQEYLFMGQPLATEAGVVVVVAADVERLLRKYGDRGYRYMLFEAGHVAQNLNLAATALGLGSCNLGGFFDLELGNLLGVEAEAEIPLYAVAAGVPEDGTRDELRGVGGAAEP